jgi:DNA-3-methyladenine glycosylase II
MMTLDHPAWTRVTDGQSADRLVKIADAIWLVHAGPGAAATMSRVRGDCGERPVLDTFDPEHLTAPARLARPLKAAGVVRRLRNPDLWDALANSIIRQVIRAPHARTMYRTFCQEFGETLDVGVGALSLVPSADMVAELSDSEFTRVGMAFKASALRHAALAYRAHRLRWQAMGPRELQVAVQDVPRIGPWTAGAAVADYTGDFSLYPFGDLAVRTWATTLAPAMVHPDTEPAFAAHWKRLGGSRVAELTMLTLAWGTRQAHAHT